MTAAGALLAMAAVAGAVILIAATARLGWELGADIYDWIHAEDQDEGEDLEEEPDYHECGQRRG